MKSFFKVYMIFCVVGALSFFAFGDQEGICVDCVQGDQTELEIQNFKKFTCKSQIKLPECKNVPGILRPDCDNLPTDPGPTIAAVCGPISIGSMTAIVFSLKKIFSLPTIYRFLPLGSPIARSAPWVSTALVGSGVMFLAAKAYYDSKNDKGLKNQAHQGFYYSLAKKLYDIEIGDSHCYNEVIKAARLCGFIAGIIGVTGVAGGVAGGAAGLALWSSRASALGSSAVGGLVGGGTGFLFSGSMARDVLEQYEQVRDDTLKRLKDVKDTPPSATETLDTLLNEALQ